MSINELVTPPSSSASRLVPICLPSGAIGNRLLAIDRRSICWRWKLFLINSNRPDVCEVLNYSNSGFNCPFCRTCSGCYNCRDIFKFKHEQKSSPANNSQLYNYHKIIFLFDRNQHLYPLEDEGRASQFSFEILSGETRHPVRNWVSQLRRRSRDWRFEI